MGRLMTHEKSSENPPERAARNTLKLLTTFLSKSKRALIHGKAGKQRFLRILFKKKKKRKLIALTDVFYEYNLYTVLQIVQFIIR